MIALVVAALAADIEVKVHDMTAALPADAVVTVVIRGNDGTTLELAPRDDGAGPDAVAGDHLYTAVAPSMTVRDGGVRVEAAGRSWEGGFAYDASSDPVLLIGLERNGFAAASTREIQFAPGAGPGAVPAGAPVPGVPGTTGPIGAPGAAAGPPREGDPPAGGGPRAGLPDGVWVGWLVVLGAIGATAFAAWAGARRGPRLPRLPPPRPTDHRRGAWTPADHRLDVVVGPLIPGVDATGARVSVGDGRWTPDEILLFALAQGQPVRVVVTTHSAVDTAAEPYADLSRALRGYADLLWVDASIS